MATKLGSRLKADDSYQKYTAIVKGYSFKVKPLKKEIEDLHSKRTSRKLFKKSQLTPKLVATSTLRDQSYRSRIVSLIMQATHQYNLLATSHESVLLYVANCYGSMIPGRAKADKRAYLEATPIFMLGAEYIQELASFLELAQWVQQDIDQAQWATKLTMKALEIGLHRELTL